VSELQPPTQKKPYGIWRIFRKIFSTFFLVVGGIVTILTILLYGLGITLGGMSVSNISSILYDSKPKEIVQGLQQLFATLGVVPSLKATPAATCDERWVQDIDYLLENITKLHVLAWVYTTPEALSTNATTLKQKIPTLSDRELVVEMSHLLAPIGDGHTGISSRNSAFPLHVLPIKFKWLKDGLFITGASSDYADLVGAKVLQADQTPILEATRKTFPHLTSENTLGDWANAEYALRRPEFLYVAGITKELNKVNFVLQMTDGQQQTVTFASDYEDNNLSELTAKSEPLPMYLENPDTVFWFRYLPESQTVYLKYNSCEDHPGFSKLTQEILTAIHTKPFARLVIDLRGNGGGDSSVINPLLEGIAARGLNKQPGKLFVLTDKDTFSSAFHGLLELRKRNAIHIGEAPSQKLNYGGNVTSFELPNSKLGISYPTQDSAWLAGVDIRIIEPDIKVEATSKEFSAGQDPILEAAISNKPYD
jgi:hypothetical protein